MPTSARPYEPDPAMPLPAAPRDWLPAGHRADVIDDTVDALNPRRMAARSAGCTT